MSGEGLLPDEPAIAIQRNAIRALGAHDLAVFVQQVNYSSRHGGEDRDGCQWAVRSLDEWCTDCVLTPRQAERIIAALVKKGIIVRWQPPGTMDRRAWTRIDWDVLGPMLSGVMHHHVSRGHSTTDRVDTAHAKRGDVPTTKTGVREPPDTHPPTDVGRSAAQEAQRVLDDYWRHVKSKSGRHPIGITPIAFKKLITPFLDAGVEVRALKVALSDMYERGSTLTRQGIERQLDGRGAKKNGQRSTMDGLRELEFDGAGNLICE